MGSSTAITRSARVFSVSRSAKSNLSQSTVEFGLRHPDHVAELPDRLGGTPRRRIPARVGMRGSSQPQTCPSCTSAINLRFDMTVFGSASRFHLILPRSVGR